MIEYLPNSHAGFNTMWILIFIYYFSWPGAGAGSRSRNFDVPAPAPAPAKSSGSLRLRLHNTGQKQIPLDTVQWIQIISLFSDSDHILSLISAPDPDYLLPVLSIHFFIIETLL